MSQNDTTMTYETNNCIAPFIIGPIKLSEIEVRFQKAVTESFFLDELPLEGGNDDELRHHGYYITFNFIGTGYTKSFNQKISHCW